MIDLDRDAGDKHPCSKPLEAWKLILDERTQHGDTVLDPFAGSAKTVIFLNMTINFSSEKYCRIAIDRLRQRELF